MALRAPLLVGTVLVFALIPILANATLITFDSRAEWDSAVHGLFYTETFESVPMQRIPSGTGGTLETPTFNIFLPPGMIHGASISDHLTVDGTRGYRGDLHSYDAHVLEFNEFQFDRPILAFAADFGYVEDKPGVFLTIGLEGSSALRYAFTGVVSDTPFTTVVVHPSGGPFIYDMDNVSTAPALLPAERLAVHQSHRVAMVRCEDHGEGFECLGVLEGFDLA
jgi:hypothetical protein